VFPKAKIPAIEEVSGHVNRRFSYDWGSNRFLDGGPIGRKHAVDSSPGGFALGKARLVESKYWSKETWHSSCKRGVSRPLGV